MNLENQIMSDLKVAMKSKNQAALRGIRAIKAAILLAKTSGASQEQGEDAQIKMLQKLVKQRQESFEIYKSQGREDLANVEAEEIEVIKKYLPEQLSIEEIEQVVQNIIAQTGASGMKDMGRVMGQVSGQLAGKADGKTIANIVKNILSNA